MNTDYRKLVEQLDRDRLIEIASGATGVRATSAGITSVDEISAVHTDQRTVAILRVTGTAGNRGPGKDWSSVVKVIDFDMAPNAAVTWNDPGLEEEIYSQNRLVGASLPFRPVRCFGTAPMERGLKGLWLEDLTGAPRPPWTLEQYLRAANHLGRFDGHHALHPAETDWLDLPRHNFAERWTAAFRTDFSELTVPGASEIVKRYMKPGQLKTILETADRVPALLETGRHLPVSLKHGDSHARNRFPVGDETVAIDWAGIARDPVGTSAGVLVGSGLTWGIEEHLTVRGNIERLYGEYVDGLRASGWDGPGKEVRTGFFCQFGVYLFLSVTIIPRFQSPEILKRRAFFEARFGTTLEEMPGRAAESMPVIVEYMKELVSLAQ